MLAIIGVDSERVTAMLVNGLAVLGGFLAGFVVFGVLAWFLDRWLTGGKAPVQLKKGCRVVGGIIVAVIVAYILFNSGGTGNGGDKNGGGPTTQSGNGDQPGTGSNQQTAPVEKPPVEDPATIKDANAKIETIIVTVVTGEDEPVSGKKYYRIELDGKTDIYTLDDLFGKLLDRHKPPEKIIRITPRYLAHGGEDTPSAIQLITRGRLENIFVATGKDKK